MRDWEYVLWAANGLIGIVNCGNVSLAVIRLVGALTRDPVRSRQCAEMLRLSHKDAQDMPSLLPSASPRTRPEVNRGRHRREDHLRKHGGREERVRRGHQP